MAKTQKKHSKRPSSKGWTKNSKGKDADLPDDKGGASDNDVSWYANNEYLLRDAGNLAFANPAGKNVEIDAVDAFNVNTPGTTAPSFFVNPSVMALYVLPMVGEANDATDPVNVAMRNIFSYSRSWNTAGSPYNAAQEMIFILAMDSAYSFYSFCARVYGLIRTYAQRNRALPQALFASMGLDYDDFAAHISDFRFWLNTIGEKIGSLCVPASMSYTMRHMWLFQNVFLDGPTDKSQMYIYNPSGFFKFNPVGHQGASATDITPCLDFVHYMANTVVDSMGNAANYVGVDALIQFGNELIRPLFEYSMFNTISGDILKSFGADKIWKLVPIHEDYEIIPIINSEVLDQIHNATCLNMRHTAWNKTDVLFEQIDASNATSFLKVNEYILPDQNLGGVKPIALSAQGFNGVLIDFDHSDVTPAEVMVATRLTSIPLVLKKKTGNATNVTMSQVMCGSEIVTAMALISPASNGASAPNVNGWTFSPMYTFMEYGGIDYPAWEPFYKHPIIMKCELSVASTQAQVTRYFPSADIENVTVLNRSVLRKLHETALLSQFAVPLMGAFGRKA